MKKNSKKQTKREQNAKQAEAKLCALSQREANSLVIGVDLGDRVSNYCVRTLKQEKVAEGTVATTPPGMAAFFQKLQRQRVVMETGTHARWVAELLSLIGHEVIVGNSRKLKLITENTQKSDQVDARLLSERGCMGIGYLHPVYQRSSETHRDLLMVRARQALIDTRTALIGKTVHLAVDWGPRRESARRSSRGLSGSRGAAREALLPSDVNIRVKRENRKPEALNREGSGTRKRALRAFHEVRAERTW